MSKIHQMQFNALIVEKKERSSNSEEKMLKTTKSQYQTAFSPFQKFPKNPWHFVAKSKKAF